MTTFILMAYIVIFILTAYAIYRISEMQKQMLLNHGALVGMHARNMEDIKLQLVDLKALNKESHQSSHDYLYEKFHYATCQLDAIAHTLKEEDYKNSDHLRKIVEETARELNVAIEKAAYRTVDGNATMARFIEDKIAKTIDHVSVATNNVMHKVNSESEEIKDFIKLQHTTSVSNHGNADKKIEAVFQRVNNAVGLAKRIPSL